MTITYDAEGKCTQCESTGWLPVAQRHPGDHPQTHATIFSVKPCHCHGWRPIETAPDDGRLCRGFSRYGQGDFRRIGSSWCDSDGRGGPRVWTHWQSQPQPPEES